MSTAASKSVVRSFLKEVRSGRYPERADWYMAPLVQAHQFNAEEPITVMRSPADYAQHICNFRAMFGEVELELTELLAEGDKVYARWIQYGRDLQEIDGFAPTGRELVEYTSAVYQVVNGKIVAYWLQTDRLGMQLQLIKNQEQG